MGKKVVITGAGAGLGRALAHRFARESETIILLGRTLEKLEKVVEEAGGAAEAIACDVASSQSVREAFERIGAKHGGIDVLINNAAIYVPSYFRDVSDDLITQTLLTNAAGAMYCARAALPLLGRGGSIINVSSEAVDMNFPMMSLYQASKAAIERFSKSLAEEVRGDGVRVTFVRCGPMMDEEKVLAGDPKVLAEFHSAMVKAGINPRERGVSHFNSVTDVFHFLVNLPPDLEMLGALIGARKP